LARLGTLRFVHLGELTAVAVSPNGKLAASGVWKGKAALLEEKVRHERPGIWLNRGEPKTQSALRLWDARTGKLLREVLIPEAPVSALLFGPAGRVLFAGCGRFLCAYDTATGKKLWQREGVPGGGFHCGVNAERLLLAGGKLISLHGGTLDCTTRVEGGQSFSYHPQVVVRSWDSRTGKVLPTPAALQSTVDAEGRIATLFQDAAVSPDGRFVAVRACRATPVPFEKPGPGEERWKYADRRLLVVDLQTGKACQTLPAGKEVVETSFRSLREKFLSDGLAFSADGGTLAVQLGGDITLVPARGGRKRLLAKGLEKGVGLAFLGAKRLAARLPDGKVRAWDVVTGKEQAPDPADALAFVPTNNGRVAAAAHGNTVRLTWLRSGKPVHPLKGHRLTPVVRFALDSPGVLLSRDVSGRACLWGGAGVGPEGGVFPQRPGCFLP
jgi:WD40 repeat protein